MPVMFWSKLANFFNRQSSTTSDVQSIPNNTLSPRDSPQPEADLPHIPSSSSPVPKNIKTPSPVPDIPEEPEDVQVSPPPGQLLNRNLSIAEDRPVKTPPRPPAKPKPILPAHNLATSMFDGFVKERAAPELPPTAGIGFPRAASWSSSTVADILADPIGRQVFRCFLFEALAEENLLFVEKVEEIQKLKNAADIQTSIQDLLDQYGSYINLSSNAMKGLNDAVNSDKPDKKCLDVAYKEIMKLLENDQFPRFRRSALYIGFLEKLLPRAYAEAWANSFDALIGNTVGRHHFRQFLINVHAEENLRFWEAVQEFKGQKNKSPAMWNMGRTIQQQYLREGAHTEIFLPHSLRQKIDEKIKAKDVDVTLFDEAIKHVEQILKNDPFVRFLQSEQYTNLLNKLD
uniref:RGS domain-containing protein n=1 Tax=Acrobeloides nanus TaxID=290746 RepID=A0A914BVR4_9BILA